MPDPTLVFDERTHQYSVGARVLPSVTQIIAPLHDWGMVPVDVLDRKAELGRIVHACTALDDQGQLDEGSVIMQAQGYLEAWRRFRREKQPQWTAIEEPMSDLTLGYAGTPDRIGVVDKHFCVVEIKAVAQLVRAYGVQLVGYSAMTKRPCRRLVVQLKPDSSYRMRWYDEADDWRVFTALLSLTHWRNKHAA